MDSDTTRPNPYSAGALKLRPLEFLVLALFFGSGASALIYEVVWSRELTFIFGGSAFAIATVLAAYMAGLALGSAWFGRKIDQKGHPMVVYGLLEAAIGIWAMILPLLFQAANGVYTSLYQDLSLGYYPLSLIRFLLCFVLLLVPTTMMGGTLPVLGKLLLQNREGLGAKAGLLYGINTVGAVAGVILGGFILIPNLGLSGATWIAIGINLVIALASIVAARFVRTAPARNEVDSPAESTQDAASSPALRTAVLWVYAASGFAALTYEVAWTKTLALVLGTTSYAFSSMLATFLLGLSIGAFLFGKLADRTGKPVSLLAVVQIGIPLLAVLTIPILGRLPHIFVDNFDAIRESWVSIELFRTLLAASTMILPAILMGGTFPLVTRVFVDRKRMGSSLGRLYAFNTMGAILGSFLAGFVLIPLVGRQSTILVATLVNLGAALALMGVVRWRGLAVWSRATAAGLLLLLIPAGVLGFQKWDPLTMSAGVYYYADRYSAAGSIEAEFSGVALLLYDEGTEATISVWQSGHAISFRVNGKVDASSHGDMITQKFLGHLPALYHRGPLEQTAVIGLASGATAGALLTHPVKKLEAIELIESVPKATKLFADYNNNCLDDPRMEVVINDGRNHLQMTSTKYSLISSEPPNPWVAGVGSLFTDRFYEITKERLAPGGIVCQWVQIYHMRDTDITAILATFADAFPYVHLWRGNLGDLLLVGSMDPLSLDPERLTREFDGPVGDDLAAVDIKHIPSLLAFFITDRNGILDHVAGRELRVTDDNLFLEYSIPRHIFETEGMTTSAAFEPVTHHGATILDPPIEDPEMLARIQEYQASQLLSVKAMFDVELPAGVEDRMGAWRMALERAPNEALGRIAYSKSLNMFGINAMQLDNALKAEGYFREALRLGPRVERALALTNIGLIFHNRNEPDSAAYFWDESSKLEPRNPTLRYNLGVLASSRNDWETAESELELCLSYAPDNAQAMQSLAYVKAKRGDLKTAEKRIGEALRLAPSPEAQRIHGYILIELKRWDEAIAELAPLVRENPDYMWGTLQLARAHMGRGNDREAERLLNIVTGSATDPEVLLEAQSLLRSQ